MPQILAQLEASPAFMDGTITTIIEPFCGSCAVSYFIARKYPRRFKYVLNDNNADLIRLLNDLRSGDDAIRSIVAKLREMGATLTKEKHRENNKVPYYGWIYQFVVYGLRPTMYPAEGRRITALNNLESRFLNAPIVQFLRTEDVIITHGDGVDCYERHSADPTNLIFLDPPYMQSSNDYYSEGRGQVQIYEYLHTNQLTPQPNPTTAMVMVCLEDMWIIRLLFRHLLHTATTHAKKYEISKKQTSHIICVGYSS
jgi:site-specific DNA-adenine methylase